MRNWLHLPHDVPVSYMHAAGRDGGLGVPCLQYFIPLHKFNRFRKFPESSEPRYSAIGSCDLVKSVIYRSTRTLAFLGENPTIKGYSSFWRAQLLNKVDGRDLEGVENHASSSKWNTGLCNKISGRDYIHYHAVRTNSIPTKVRTSRGLPNRNLMCRAGCQETETFHHVTQKCFRTHGGRIMRHDRVVDLLSDETRSRGFVVHKEPRLTTSAGLRKPDLVLVKDDVAHVVDVQVVWTRDLERSHACKITKYQGIAGFDDVVKSTYNIASVLHSPCTLSYKGIWSKRSAGELRRLGVSDFAMHMVVTSVLRGAWLGWRRFNLMTSVRGFVS